MPDEQKTATPQPVAPAQHVAAVRARLQQHATEGVTTSVSPDFRSVYVNNVAFGTSAFDMSFTFGEIQGVEGNRLLVEQKVKIIMSPLHAKIFANVMAQNIQLFEQTYGEIKMPGGQQVVVSQDQPKTTSPAKPEPAKTSAG